MLKTPMAVAVLAALSLGVVANANADTTITAAPTSSQDTSQSTDTNASSSDSSDKKASKLDTVVVSGSLINNAQIQTASPTYTITSTDIKARGFNSVTEVLQNAVQATGSTASGPQNTAGFTPGAQSVSLYGLNPEFTLLLIDGKPITNFGQLYNGQSNFNNISNIPISLIDHIDIMPGGGSSIYGSSAIAGVVNIVTKQHMDGGEIDVRTGNYDGGGGANQRINAAWGHDFGKLNVLAATEFDNSSPLWGYQRRFTDGSLGNPGGTTPEQVTSILNYGNVNTFTGAVQGFIAPPNGCGAISSLYGGTTVLTNSTTPGQPGQYCGSQKVNGFTTFINQSRSYDGLLKLRYDLSDNVRLYSDVLLDWQQQKWTNGPQYNWWGPYYEGQYVQDQYGNIVTPQHIFAPEEIPGGYTGLMETQDDLMYQADIGANGHFGDSGWDWDFYYLRSGDRTTTVEPERNLQAIDNYYQNNVLGPVQGTNSLGMPIYNINYNAFFSPLSPSTYNSFSLNVNGLTNTWINNTRLTLSNSSLFALPGGDAGVAALLEGGNEAWYQPASPQLAAGEVWGLTGTSGGGQRQHRAGAFEFNAPIFKQLTLDLSGRYDYYTIQGASNNKFTYKIGLEYRPFDNWLIRGNYSTAFRAPDMSSLFLGPSGFYSSYSDPYQCAIQHATNCGLPQYVYQFEGTLNANTQLKPTTASSWTVGTVWAPINNLSLSVDYLHIDITNEVVQQDIPTLLALDAQCLLGQLDPTSLTCQKTVAQVQRNDAGILTNVATYFQNLASEQTNSITAEAKYTFPETHVGQFGLQLDYNDMLKHSYQLYPGTAPINDLTNSFYSSEFKDITAASVSWNLHNKWSSTIYYHRYSPSPNYIGMTQGISSPGAGRVGVWNTYNYSLTYTPVPNLDLSFLINNVFNKMPPSDPTYTVYPYYNTGNYNVYGREYMLQASLRFGGKTGS
jgi:iron complex outermembrane recepter protein